MGRKQKLELTWIGKEKRERLEPRVLIEDEAMGHAAAAPDGSLGLRENLLIKGDNLLALKALEAEYTGRVKGIYIDPPYNSGNAFTHYDDGVEHSIWLSLMRSRLLILRRLLTQDGFICVQIDDGEGHYLKVLLDEIFGRSNYLTTFYIQVRYPQKTLKQDMDFHKEIEMLHVYRMQYGAKPNLKSILASDEKYCWRIEELEPGRKTVLLGKTVEIFKDHQYRVRRVDPSEDGLKEIWATGTILDGNSSGRFFRDALDGRVNDDGLGCLYKVENIGNDHLPFRYFTGPKRQGATKGKYYQGMPMDKRLEGSVSYYPIENYYDLAGSFGNCRHEGGVDFRSGKKPEKLLEIVLQHFTNPGDLVLDSFAGSGTTGAVAHKMGRRWIMVELGDHADTHIVPRLKRVIDGKDSGGVTEVTGWQGGGGYRYFRLAPSLLEKDQWGQLVISKDYKPEMLAEAVCKLMGFTYAPSQDHFWRHGHSTEADFIYVTTQRLTHDALRRLSHEVGEGRSLLVCCRAHDPNTFDNLTLRKIPQAVMTKCEWGRDDYSLNIQEAPSEPITAADLENGDDDNMEAAE